MSVGAVIAAARLLDCDDLVEDNTVLAGEEGPTVNNHVDFVCAISDCFFGVHDLDRQRGASARERGCHGGNVNSVVRTVRPRRAKGLSCVGNHVAVNAHRCDLRGRGIRRVRQHGFGRERANFARSVCPLQRRQVNELDDGVESPGLRRCLDRACAQTRSTLLEPDSVDAGKTLEMELERLLGQI